MSNSNKKTKKKAVIGLGNVLRKDDGIGVSILDLLKASQKLDVTNVIDYMNFGIASFDILLRIREYSKVLIIDGINASLRPGELRIFDLDDTDLPLDFSHISSHELKLTDVNFLKKKLDIKTKVFVAGIQVQDIAFGEGLTDALLNRQGQIVEEIQRFINKEFLGLA